MTGLSEGRLGLGSGGIVLKNVDGEDIVHNRNEGDQEGHDADIGPKKSFGHFEANDYVVALKNALYDYWNDGFVFFDSGDDEPADEERGDYDSDREAYSHRVKGGAQVTFVDVADDHDGDEKEEDYFVDFDGHLFGEEASAFKKVAKEHEDKHGCYGVE